MTVAHYRCSMTPHELVRLRIRAEMDWDELGAEIDMTGTSLARYAAGHHHIRRSVAMALRYFELHYLGGPEL